MGMMKHEYHDEICAEAETNNGFYDTPAFREGPPVDAAAQTVLVSEVASGYRGATVEQVAEWQARAATVGLSGCLWGAVDAYLAAKQAQERADADTEEIPT
jgi:hypothetical protein